MLIFAREKTTKSQYIMKLKTLFSLVLSCVAISGMAQQTSETYSGSVLADEGAWCWFADPRAIHYKNADGTIDAAYIGYIDVHGAIKASQVRFDKNVAEGGHQEDVLVRSRFQPDDHNNPTFLVLPDERIMIFYARHTDDPRFYYRVSTKPGDITSLGDEHEIKVANNTTYPSPFILSDDPEHIYLCWRGINWHPTIAKLTLPDAEDKVQIEWGPYQMVQSTGARPYAKYHSNGKDKIYVAYTTGHPDNEWPNWLYFNVINLNAKKNSDGTVTTTPQLADLKGNTLSTVANGPFKVSKTSDYKSQYPNTILDSPSNSRDWVWQIALDKEDNPVVAMVKISQDKNSHQYYYARWNGTSWKLTDLANGGGKFHPSNTEYCYSGGMALDEANINDIYLSIPTQSEATGTKVYEIWKYTVSDNGTVTAKEQVTRNSLKNNVRPFVLPGSGDSKLRLGWMNGDYYYWLVRTGYPQGYPTAIHVDYEVPASELPTLAPCLNMVENKQMTATDEILPYFPTTPPTNNFTIIANWSIDHNNYGGTLLKVGDMEYGLDETSMKPYIKIGDKTYWSQSILGNADAWATQSSGTDGKWYLTKLGVFNTAITYNGTTLTVYRDGLIDQRFDVEGLTFGNFIIGGYTGTLASVKVYDAAMGQQFIYNEIENGLLETISLPSETYTDLVLPQSVGGKSVTWTSSNESVVSNTGVLYHPENETDVTLTATLGTSTQTYKVKAMPRDISKSQLLNLTFDGKDTGVTAKGNAKTNGTLDLTANTAAGFQTNGYAVADQGILNGLRSYTFLLTVKADDLNKAPRLYDFGTDSGNSLFLRANPLSAGIKYGGGATTMVTSNTTLTTGKEYKLAVTYDAATQTTRIYIDGEECASGTANKNEAYMLVQSIADTRNYIGRTQWWDSNYAADNVDFKGEIDDFQLYNITLTRKEICEAQGLEYKEKEYATALINGDFEGKYSVMSGSGVKSDRAIYVPEGWTADYTNPNDNDLTAMQSGDLYYSNFFASRPKPADGGERCYWVRQNWGESTISFYQELRLPEGEYTLTADVWKSGLGGNALIYVQTGDAPRTELSPANNAEEWQEVTHTFQCDGEAITTISFAAIHNSNGSEKIIGFDNIVLTGKPTGIVSPVHQQPTLVDVYSIDGKLLKRQTSPHKATSGLPQGIYIIGGEKVVVK